MSQDIFLVTDAIFQNWITDFFDKRPVIIPQNCKVPFGTDEWSDETYNTHEGCRHGCFYCYNWTNAWNKRSQWKRPIYTYYGKEIHLKTDWFKTWNDRNTPYTIMYPSTHDVFPETMNEAFQIMKSMLNAKNIQVLWVTKPWFEVVERFIEQFGEYKDRITIRLTITTNNNDELRFWERNASRYSERCLCLTSLAREGFTTSVSNEPMLLPVPKNENLVEGYLAFIEELLPLIKETLWIGIMNHIPVQLQFRGEYLTPEQAEHILALRKFYTNANILQIVKALYQNPKVRWKESIKKRMISIMRKTRR